MLRILLVDDDPGVRQVYQKVFIDQGFRVLAFDNAIDALAAMYGTGEQFDAALVDLVLPGLDGATFTRILRAVERARGNSHRTRVVLTTGFSPDRVGVEVLVGTVDCDDFIPKPSSNESIIRAVSGS